MKYQRNLFSSSLARVLIICSKGCEKKKYVLSLSFSEIRFVSSPFSTRIIDIITQFSFERNLFNER